MATASAGVQIGGAGLRAWARGLDRRAWTTLAAAALLVGLSLALALYRLSLPYDGYTLWLDGFSDWGEGLPIADGESELLAVEDRYADAIIAGALTLSPRPPATWRIGEGPLYRFRNANGAYERPTWLRLAPWRLRTTNPLDLALMAYLPLAAYMFARRPRSLPAQLLLIYGALIVGGTLNRMVTDGWSELRLADLFDRWAFWPTLLLNQNLFGWAILLHFVLIFPRPKPWLVRTPWLALLALYALPLAWYMGAAAWSVASARPQAFFSLAAAALLALLGLGAPLALWSLWHSYHRANDATEQAQVGWVGAGMGALFGWVLLLFGAFAVAERSPEYRWLIDWIYKLAPLALVAPPACIAVAFVRYRLFDEEVQAAATRMTAALRRSREGLVAAREEERRRLRRDLHDGLGPTLAGLTLKLDAARNTLPRDPAGADALLLELRGQIQGAVGEIRRLVYGLHPPALDQLGLAGALEELAAQYEPGLRVELDLPDELPGLPVAVEVALYRIAQEAITNVARHSGASHCLMRVAARHGELELLVEDAGVGVAVAQRAGVGLVAMCERAEELGGSCVVEQREGGGTRVRAVLLVG